jgi:hypothetical protein
LYVGFSSPNKEEICKLDYTGKQDNPRISDTLFLTLRMGSLDIDGTKKLARDIYGSFSKFGAKSHLVLNKMAGYCTSPQVTVNVATLSSSRSFDTAPNEKSYNKTITIQQQEERDKEVGSRHEYHLCNSLLL